MTSPWSLCHGQEQSDRESRPHAEKRISKPSCKPSNQTGQPHRCVAEPVVSCTTFNILAPIYKRIGSESCRESQFRKLWLPRNESILNMLLLQRSSIICLQEVWLGNEELVSLYDKAFSRAGYRTYKLPRTNDRGDGLLTAINTDRLSVLNYKELLFYDCGDRVTQFFHLQLRLPSHKQGHTCEELLLVNTHLLFPHDSTFCLVRLWQVYKIIECLERFKIDHGLRALPVILCGDWNGSKRGHVYKFLRSQGFVSSYDSAHSYTDSDAHRWVSHRNHRGNICGVDFIWLLNPGKRRKSLSASWKEAVLGIIKAKIIEAGLTARDASRLWNLDKNQDIVCLLHQLGLTRMFQEGLTRDEIRTLVQPVDLQWKASETEEINNGLDENDFWVGPLRSKEQSRIPGPPPLQLNSDPPGKADLGFRETKVHMYRQPGKPNLECFTGFSIKDAFLFPPEVEQGIWPDSYTLSDHAPLTVTFSCCET